MDLICCEPGCIKHRKKTGSNTKTGKIYYKKRCAWCDQKYLAKKNGLPVHEFKNQYHPYLKYRKSYCENLDGRLGFKCDYTIRHSAHLTVDHIDGNHQNNNIENLQTLCVMCHIIKTHMYKDYATPGRKTRKKDEQ